MLLLIVESNTLRAVQKEFFLFGQPQIIQSDKLDIYYKMRRSVTFHLIAGLLSYN